MTQLQCCVIIPTYNNAKTLKKVVDGVLHFTSDCIVVNDGSTDETLSVLDDYPSLVQIHVSKNRGKGNALRLAFKKAVALGYRYAITLDSDGQHFPSDIPLFLDALERAASKKVLLVGARNMAGPTVPKKSNVGNRFSNFWMWVMTGEKLTDTQSGFRLYPIAEMKDLRLFTWRFEFEVEAMVKAAWLDISIVNIPIHVHYDASERVSHYRPFTDFIRISLLNTWLVLIAILYIKPRNLIRKLRKKGFRRFLQEDLLHNNDSPKKKALSIALGIFIGLSPLWGLHTIIVLFLAILFKLNKVIAFAFSNISLPPFIPFVLYASAKVGQLITGQDYAYTMEEMSQNFEVLKHLRTYIIGSLVLATLSALILGTASFVLFVLFHRKKIIINNG